MAKHVSTPRKEFIFSKSVFLGVWLSGSSSFHSSKGIHLLQAHKDGSYGRDVYVVSTPRKEFIFSKENHPDGKEVDRRKVSTPRKEFIFSKTNISNNLRCM